MESIITVLCIIISMFFPCKADDAVIVINNEVISAETRIINFTLTNTTNRCIINECWVSSFEKKVDGEWVEQEYEFLIKEIAFTVYPNRTVESSFKVKPLSEGEYRIGVDYNVRTTLTKTITGHSTAYFIVSG